MYAIVFSTQSTEFVTKEVHTLTEAKMFCDGYLYNRRAYDGDEDGPWFCLNIFEVLENGDRNLVCSTDRYWSL